MNKLNLVVSSFLLFTVACSAAPEPGNGGGGNTTGALDDTDAGTAKKGNGTQIEAQDCSKPLVAANISGGCNLRLVTPQPCEEIDLSNGRSYEFAWTTDGSGCETPWTVYVGGNPLEDGNILSAQLSTDVSSGITKTGGVINVTAQDLAQLKSDNGYYTWTVKSYYGSQPATVTFKVVK
jgi:hypothetical protein